MQVSQLLKLGRGAVVELDRTVLVEHVLPGQHAAAERGLAGLIPARTLVLGGEGAPARWVSASWFTRSSPDSARSRARRNRCWR